MSQKVKAKVIKNKKKFPWGKIWYYIKSLFSNAICLDISTSLKWFWSIIVFVLVLLVSVVQPTVTNSQISGAQLINSTASDTINYGLTDYVERTTNIKEGEKDYSIKFDVKTSSLSGTYQYDTYSDYVVSGDAATSVIKPFFTSFHNGQRMLDIYVGTTYSEETSFITNIVSSNPVYGDASKEEREEFNKVNENFKYTRTTSCIIFTQNNIYVLLCDGNGNQAAQLNGNFKYVLEAFPELSKNSTYSLTEALGYGLTPDLTATEKCNIIVQNSANYFHKVYIDPVFTQTWVTFGIYCGVNGGIMIVMAFIIFAMTRGKNNPNRSIKLLQCFSIAFWFAITPALISISLGFAIPQFGPMLFLITYSFRVMFLSMKYLRPSYQ